MHEYLTCDGADWAEHLSAIRMRRNHDGARRKDPKTYLRDVGVLEGALQTETNTFLRARYRFYLAQSYRDSHMPENALPHYLARAELGFWQEEVFVSLYNAAQLKEQLGHPEQEVSTLTFAPRPRCRHGPRRCMGQANSAATRGATKKDISSPNVG